MCIYIEGPVVSTWASFPLNLIMITRVLEMLIVKREKGKEAFWGTEG